LHIVQILIFGFALTNEVKNAKLLIISTPDEIQNQTLIDKIEASSYFTITHIESTEQNIDFYFKNGEIQLTLDLSHTNPSNPMETREIQIIADSSDPNFAKIAINYLSAIIYDWTAAQNNVENIPLQIKTETRMLYNPTLNSSMNFVPGLIAMIMMIICTTLTSISIVREKEFGMMEVLLVSPVRPINVLISKMIPYFVLSVLNLSIIFLLSYFVLDVPIHGNIIFILIVSMLFILVCLALGLFISNATSSQAFAMMFSMAGILLPILLFTGFLFPIENMPIAFQWLSYIVPSRWYFLIMQSVMLKGLSIVDVWFETSILFLMMIIMLGISLKKFKTRLQ
jgi:ABC-2 type transport system permease protein